MKKQAPAATPFSATDLRTLLEGVAAGAVSIAEAARALQAMPAEELGFASLDHHRAMRKGFPEVVFCQGKTPAQVAEIVSRMAKTGQPVLGTRANEAHYRAAKKKTPAVVFDALARTLTIEPRRSTPRAKGIVLVSAGTADLPVAEEALLTARAMGSRAELVADVGVAGLHRLLAHHERLREARVLVVVAGLEGALPSVVGGLTDRPLIAVPTSVGYGAHFNGLAPLLAMLNSCAAGVTVVNIDNGFGAGYAAHLINTAATRR